ncbi:hypothetical protein BJ684DRAFT_1797, partial [Piptocephalis cylindrospora]
LKALMWKWHLALTQAIKQRQVESAPTAIQGLDGSDINGLTMDVEADDISESQTRAERNVDKLLSLIDPERLSILTINEVLRQHAGSTGDGIKAGKAISSLGRDIEQEYGHQTYSRQSKKSKQHKTWLTIKANQQLDDSAMYDMEKRSEATRSLRESGELEHYGIRSYFTLSTRTRIGGLLISMLLDCAKVMVDGDEVSAMYLSVLIQRGQRLGVIGFHPKILSYLSRERVSESLDPRYLPMLVHPRPWVTYNNGGYITKPSYCMRIKGSREQLEYLKQAGSQEQMNVVLAGLDVLGSTQWRINRPIFDLILKSWNTGEAYPSIPRYITSPVLPKKPVSLTEEETADTSKVQQHRKEIKLWYRECQLAQREYQNAHSQRCDVNYKVEIARAFLNESPFFFPHNLDFRGRAYPIPPLFNHLGNDLCRGLLEFAEGKPLGSRGLQWLKIQVASLAGYDKASHEERLTYADEHYADIEDSVDRPFEGNGWWLKAEDPWQCLASSMELVNAMRSGKPEEYVSHQPIHQDGTCNGLQHYAALGGDVDGAIQVNLLPSERPQDVYTGVARLVIESVEQDAKENNPSARVLLGRITRKVVKQTVMTNVYGVTFVGAREQIENRMREIKVVPTPKITPYSVSLYLTSKVFQSLDQMFSGAQQIQAWLNESARRIAKSVPAETIEEIQRLKQQEKLSCSLGGEPLPKDDVRQLTSVIWTTPLGLPIVQPYRKKMGRVIRTALQVVTINDPDVATQVNVQRQRTAFPPNYIHSLDATHMLLSAVACRQRDLTFAAVHDSYWTHAADIDTLNAILREQFIHMHSQPLMENLYKEFVERYQGYKVP